MSKERILASHRVFDNKPEDFSIDELSTLKEMRFTYDFIFLVTDDAVGQLSVAVETYLEHGVFLNLLLFYLLD